MSNLPAPTGRADLKVVHSSSREYVTVRLAGQLLGIPVMVVHDVLSAQKLTRIPLAPSWVAGVLNLRGRIVTAIDLRHRLGFKEKDSDTKRRDMSVVVDHHGESYSLQIDSVGEVLALDESAIEKNPVTLDQRWREISRGIFRLDEELLVIVNVDKLLDFDTSVVAA